LRLIRDNTFFGELALLAAIWFSCLLLSLAVNKFRADPISLTYRTPEQRLNTMLSALAASEEAPGELREASLAEIKDAAARHIPIFDARPHLLFVVGHIPGAINLSRDTFASDYVGLKTVLDPLRAKELIVYCSDADCEDSSLVARALKRLKFLDVRVFRGGWEEWQSANLPEEKASE
jgi:rhodanese-related sulfurtransferase